MKELLNQTIENLYSFHDLWSGLDGAKTILQKIEELRSKGLLTPEELRPFLKWAEIRAEAVGKKTSFVAHFDIDGFIGSFDLASFYWVACNTNKRSAKPKGYNRAQDMQIIVSELRNGLEASELRIEAVIKNMLRRHNETSKWGDKNLSDYSLYMDFVK